MERYWKWIAIILGLVLLAVLLVAGGVVRQLLDLSLSLI